MRAKWRRRNRDGLNLVIAVTDGDWFDMLRQQPNLAEVNFWAPSAASFRALQPGELFLFKLHAPRNVIVGCGIFAYPTRYKEDEMRRFTLDHWEFFYKDATGKTVNRGYVNLLWPNLLKYLEIWNSTRSENFWAAGQQMVEDLSRANVAAPTWPRGARAKSAGAPTTYSRDLDDEVPF